MTLIDSVTCKAADVIEHQFGVVEQGKTADDCAAEKLVAEAAKDWEMSLIFDIKNVMALEHLPLHNYGARQAKRHTIK